MNPIVMAWGALTGAMTRGQEKDWKGHGGMPKNMRTQNKFIEDIGNMAMISGMGMSGPGTATEASAGGGAVASQGGGAWYDNVLGGMQKVDQAKQMYGSISGTDQQQPGMVQPTYNLSEGSNQVAGGYDYGQYMPAYESGGIPNNGKPAVIYDMASMQPTATMNEEGPEYIVPAYSGEGNYSLVQDPIQRSAYVDEEGFTNYVGSNDPETRLAMRGVERVTDPSNPMVQEGYSVTRGIQPRIQPQVSGVHPTKMRINDLIGEEQQATQLAAQYQKVGLSPGQTMQGEQSVSPEQVGVQGKYIEPIRKDKGGFGDADFGKLAYGLVRGLGFYYDMRKARYGLGKSAISRYLDWHEGGKAAEVETQFKTAKARREEVTAQAQREYYTSGSRYKRAQTEKTRKEIEAMSGEPPLEIFKTVSHVNPETGKEGIYGLDKSGKEIYLGETYVDSKEVDKTKYEKGPVIQDPNSSTNYSQVYIDPTDPTGKRRFVVKDIKPAVSSKMTTEEFEKREAIKSKYKVQTAKTKKALGISGKDNEADTSLKRLVKDTMFGKIDPITKLKGASWDEMSAQDLERSFAYVNDITKNNSVLNKAVRNHYNAVKKATQVEPEGEGEIDAVSFFRDQEKKGVSKEQAIENFKKAKKKKWKKPGFKMTDWTTWGGG